MDNSEQRFCPMIDPNPLDIIASKNLEGLESARQKAVAEKSHKREKLVLHYLRKKLPYGDVKLEFVHSLPKKEFNRFLIKARRTRIWRAVWPGIITAAMLALFNIFCLKPEKPVPWWTGIVAVISLLIFFFTGVLFAGRLMGVTETEEEES